MGKIPITQLEKSRAGLRVQVLSPQNPGLLSTNQWTTCSPAPSTTIQRLCLSSFTLKGLWVPAAPHFAELAHAMLSGRQEMAMEPHLY